MFYLFAMYYLKIFFAIYFVFSRKRITLTMEKYQKLTKTHASNMQNTSKVFQRI